MSSFPDSPRLIKAGPVIVDADTARVLRIISLQYNSDSLVRTSQVETADDERGDRVEPVRFKGPAVETFELDGDCVLEARQPSRYRVRFEVTP